MPQARSNMLLVCVTVGLVLLASKYRNNVLRSVRHISHSIRNRGSIRNEKEKKAVKEFKVTLDKIILADSPETCDNAVQRIQGNLSNGILGFDCEWVGNGPVAILQLATFNGVCALFRIGKIGYIPYKLKELLANEHILKVGVASFEDGKKIVQDYGCKVRGTLDLRTLAQSLNLPSPKSLAAMSLHYLGLEMDKIIEVRCGDWNACTLTDEQVAYAACDAIASVLIYHQILHTSKQNYSIWKNCIHNIKRIFSGNIGIKFHDLPDGVIDRRFKPNQSCLNTAYSSENRGTVPVPNCNGNSNRNWKQLIPIRNKPLYHNCVLQAPDGEILCTCNRKKAEWYTSKNLGEIVNTEPLTVRLKFEPAGRALGDVGQYYTQTKINQCVVCGGADKFIRKNVVPREYRKYFPVVMKAHQSHDVLLLCPACHTTSVSHDLQLKRKLADMCDASMVSCAGSPAHIRNEHMNNWRKLHTAVKVLRSNWTIPDDRRSELEQYISGRTGHQKITPAVLDVLAKELDNTVDKLSNCPAIANYQPHGFKVVQYFQKINGGLVELERIWREHFLKTMKPKYLPNLWSIHHNQERLTIHQMQNRIEPEDAKMAGLTH